MAATDDTTSGSTTRGGTTGGGVPGSPRCETRPHGRLVPVYQELRRRGVSSFADVTAELGLTAEEYERCRQELLSLGLIAPTTATHAEREALRSGAWQQQPDLDTVAAIDPEIALLRLLERERERLRDHLAEADQAYSTLEKLAGTFLRSTSLRPEIDVEQLTDYRRIQQVLEDITDVIQSDLVSMHPTSLVQEVAERVLSRDRRQIENGVRVRAIYSQHAASHPEVAEMLTRRLEVGVEVRLSPHVPMTMIIADRQFAMLPIRPENAAEGAILARGPALVGSYLGLYEHCWHMAAPFGHDVGADRGGDGLSEQQRAALRMLATGMKDEKIARTLGVSLRTVSRMLSELMQDLGAQSRFEAGVRAVRLGWLD
ncbi:helix-turn-helix transcriptional regulator [Streptomyces sp. NPDC048623]|uniref:helix-turn-helix transcriptional regulator n=1 Tax=Streptomyces sp. NPDC048623 TaxID=3155761 RepID=UPI00342457A6